MKEGILHCDLDNFFASAELISRPELRTFPIAVCGNPSSEHGIILSKNEHAKKFGVKTAETVFDAKNKCPDLILIPPNRNKYIKYSYYVRNIFLRYTDLVEPFGIDEAWLDVSGSALAFGSPETIAFEIKEKTKKELGLTLSAGVSFNKVFAKIGSDYKKPDSVTVINKNNYKNIIYPLPVDSLLFVGSKTKSKLRNMDVRTVGDLANISRWDLIRKFGKYGNTIYDIVSGNSDDHVRNYYEKQIVKSIGNGQTFYHNIKNKQDVNKAFLVLSERTALRLRKAGLLCNCVKITINTPGLISFDRQKKMRKPTDVTRDIYKQATEIFEDSWKYPTNIRMLAVTVSGLSENGIGNQLELFPVDKRVEHESDLLYKNLDRTIDDIREKFGNDSIDSASLSNFELFPGISMDYGDIE